MFAFFFYNGELPKIDAIKGCLKQIAENNANSAVIGNDKKLSDEIVNICYSIFCFQKQQKKTFTICHNSRIAKMRLSEDDGFSGDDTLFITDFISKNLLSAFAEMVAVSYLPKPKQLANASAIYYAELYSEYSGKRHPVYFSADNDYLYIFDDALTDIKLTDYISAYFSARESCNDELSAIRAVVLSTKKYEEKQAEINKIAEKVNDRIIQAHGFVKGAITFLDFLAWKGLWQKQDSDQSLNEVSGLIDDFHLKLDVLSGNMFHAANDISLSSLISISDTIAVFTPKAATASISDLIELHAQFSKYVLEQCAIRQYPIRGAITFGEYSFKKNIMIGPGIDECASWHETGNWIGVHLTPTAELYWESTGKNEHICQYTKIPLKSGLCAKYCVKWRISKEDFQKLALKNRALLPEIAGKYTNTKAFLDETCWGGGASNGQE